MRISVVPPIKVRSKKKNLLQPMWGMEMPYLQLWIALRLRAPGLDWILERLHPCLASDKLQDYPLRGYPQCPRCGQHSTKAQPHGRCSGLQSMQSHWLEREVNGKRICAHLWFQLIVLTNPSCLIISTQFLALSLLSVAMCTHASSWLLISRLLYIIVTG